MLCAVRMPNAKNNFFLFCSPVNTGACPMTDHNTPPDWQAETAAVRTAVPRTQYGENSEALFLNSSFVHPDAETAARRFAGEEDHNGNITNCFFHIYHVKQWSVSGYSADEIITGH